MNLVENSKLVAVMRRNSDKARDNSYPHNRIIGKIIGYR